MQLKEYLLKNDLSARKFAKKIKYTPQSVYSYLHGRTNISLKFAKMVEKATNGEVTVSEIVNYDAKKPLEFASNNCHTEGDTSPHQESLGIQGIFCKECLKKLDLIAKLASLNKQ